jgi:hypothetical protein
MPVQALPSSRRTLVILAAVLVLTGLAVVAMSDHFAVDDAYISLRYAHNLVAGEGFVFNPAQRVEGVTNLLWTLIMSLVIAAGLPVGYASTTLGFVMGLGGLLIAWRLAARLTNVWAGWVSIMAVAMVPSYWLAAGNGLEGGLYALLLTATIYTATFGKRTYVAGVLGGLLFLTRPESAALLPLVLLAGACGLRGDNKLHRPRLTRELWGIFLPWVAVIAGATAWRWLYFGSVLPNSVLAKRPPSNQWSDLAPLLRAGMTYTWGFLGTAYLPVCGALAALLLAGRRPISWLIALTFLGAALVAARNGGDWMQNYRLLVVYAPLLGCGLAVAWERILAWLPRSGPPVRPARAAARIALPLFLAGCLPLFFHNWRSSPSLAFQAEPHGYQTVCMAIRDALDPNAIVCAEALGKASYALPNNRFHDPAGLTDAYLARNGRLDPTFGRWDLNYTVNTVCPDLYITHGMGGLARVAQFARVYRGDFLAEYAVYTFPEGRLAVAARNNCAAKLQDSLLATGMLRVQFRKSDSR